MNIAYVSEEPNTLFVNELKRFGCVLYQFTVVDDALLKLSHDTIVVLDDATHVSKLKFADARFPIVLLREIQHVQESVEANIDSYLTSPLFGNRMIKTLEQVKHNKNTATENIPTTGSAVATPSADNTGDAFVEHDQTPNQRHFKILVVEDNKVNQQIVSLNLKKLSIDFVIANNGQEAVDIYQEQHDLIGLILMDCMMPVLDGFEATMAIRDYEKNKGIKQTHIIALTASVLDDDIKRCYESGMDDYLPKPFKRDILMEKLDARIQAS